MPDLFSVIGRRWKMILLLSFAATVLAFLLCLLSPKQYLGVATALPANSLLADKGRIFNQNIQALYTELGTPDELDKLEGTAKLDTLYLATAKEFGLVAHYGINASLKEALEKAALRLKKNTTVARTGYGELRIKVWDKDRNIAADLTNALLQKLNDIHRQLQTENNRTILVQLEKEYEAKRRELDKPGPLYTHDSATNSITAADNTLAKKAMLTNQLQQYLQLMSEYELALKTMPNALLVVEKARPSPWADKPATEQIVPFTLLASLLFSFLLAIFLEGRTQKHDNISN